MSGLASPTDITMLAADNELMGSLSIEAVAAQLAVIGNMERASRQNVQEKMAYDKLLASLATL